MIFWKWTEEKSTESEALLKFQEFKSGKRLKTGEKPNQYVVTSNDIELMTDFEREAPKGRYLLEKKS